jgi:hypothetical protein
MTLLRSTTVEKMEELMECATMTTNAGKKLWYAQEFTKHLFVASLLYLPPQRTQVFEEMRYHSTFVRGENGVWACRLSGNLVKDGQPVVLHVPDILCKYFDVYEQTIRPIRIQNALENGLHDPGYVFCSVKHLNKFSDFLGWSKQITKRYIGREIATHKFRHSMHDAIYQAAPNDRASHELLARQMGHTSEVAQRYYRIPKSHEDAEAVSNLINGKLFGGVKRPLEVIVEDDRYRGTDNDRTVASKILRLADTSTVIVPSGLRWPPEEEDQLRQAVDKYGQRKDKWITIRRCAEKEFPLLSKYTPDKLFNKWSHLLREDKKKQQAEVAIPSAFAAV